MPTRVPVSSTPPSRLPHLHCWAWEVCALTARQGHSAKGSWQGWEGSAWLALQRLLRLLPVFPASGHAQPNGDAPCPPAVGVGGASMAREVGGEEAPGPGGHAFEQTGPLGTECENLSTC